MSILILSVENNEVGYTIAIEKAHYFESKVYRNYVLHCITGNVKVFINDWLINFE